MKSKFPKMQWKVSKYRRDQRSGVLNPIKKGDFLNYLYEKEYRNEQK